MDNLTVQHSGKVVRVSGQVDPDMRVNATYTPTPGASDGILPVNGVVTFIPGPQTAFDTLLSSAHHILSHYRQSEPGTTWGCDGIGYIAQKRSGQVVVNMSGVGPRKFAQGEQERTTCPTCQDRGRR